MRFAVSAILSAVLNAVCGFTEPPVVYGFGNLSAGAACGFGHLTVRMLSLRIVPRK